MGGEQTRSRLVRSARWAVVVVPLVEVVLVVTGVLELRTGVVVGLALEALLAGVVVAEAIAFRRAYRRARGARLAGGVAAKAIASRRASRRAGAAGASRVGRAGGRAAGSGRLVPAD